MNDYLHLKDKIKLKEAIEENLREVKNCIVVMSGKGGVGKSTVSVNIANALLYLKKAVGILDADIHGPSIPKLLGLDSMRGQIQGDNNTISPIELSPNLRVMSIDLLVNNSDTPIVWRGPLKMKLISDFIEKVRWGALDFLIVDLPPGTGDEPLSVAQTLPHIDGAIIVTTPQDVALFSVRKSIKFAQDLNIPVLGLIENMTSFVCPHCNKETRIFGESKGERTASEFGIPFLGGLPISPIVSESGDRGVSLDFDDKSLLPAQKFLLIAQTIIDRLDGNNPKSNSI